MAGYGGLCRLCQNKDIFGVFIMGKISLKFA